MKKIMLTAAVLIGYSMLSACAHSNPIINLGVQAAPSNGSDGYTDVHACGTTYSYLYTGGTGKGGDVIFTKRGKVTVVLKLNNASPSDRRYTFGDVTFEGDKNEQLSWSGSAPTNGVIHDKNDAVQTASYKVIVDDATIAGCAIPCDPKIINR